MTTNSSTSKRTTRPAVAGAQNKQKRTAAKPGDLLLKTTLVAGSIVATLWGTNLLAGADAQQANADMSTSVVTAPLPAVPMTGQSTTGITLSPVTVAPIPTVRAPQGSDLAAAGLNGTAQATVPNLDSSASAATSAEIDALLNRELPTIPSIQIPVARASVSVSRSRSSR